MFEINGRTKHLAIIGHPIEHTFSPKMHNFISKKMGLNYIYTAFEVAPEDLGSAIAGIRALGFSGINVTAPHKRRVMQYLDEIAPQAQMLGTVNTVVNHNGRLIGYNTDADGFYRSLLHNGIETKNKDILILGAGGAAKPVCVMIAQHTPKSITILNRTVSKAEELASYIHKTTGFSVETEKSRKHYDIVINTTSAGMAPQLERCPIEDMSFIDRNTFVADMIYNPAQTVFLRRAKENGAKGINGLGMLIYQGIIAYELFTGTILPDSIYNTIVSEVFGQ